MTDFDAAVAKWDAEHPGNPMLDQHAAQQAREAIIALTLSNLALAVATDGIAPLVWGADEAIEVCADSVRSETGCRQIDAIASATFLIEAIASLDINWPPT